MQDATTRFAELLKIAEAAEILGVSVRTLETWISEGRIAVLRIGSRTRRVHEGDLRKFIDAARNVVSE